MRIIGGSYRSCICGSDGSRVCGCHGSSIGCSYRRRYGCGLLLQHRREQQRPQQEPKRQVYQKRSIPKQLKQCKQTSGIDHVRPVSIPLLHDSHMLHRVYVLLLHRYHPFQYEVASFPTAAAISIANADTSN
uniref:Uncharacterized protein n=1 Tax=Glossina palpalis gambiensis TaxID=67801 RepID=A0A1B0AY73_9MUSC